MPPKTNGLVDFISQKGAVTVAEYMELALSHPEFGYYMRKDPLGVKGDFTTAPEISQVFGELIGAWLSEEWHKMGKPECALAELGPGRGTLMADMLRATKNIAGFHDAVSVHLIETSPVLQQKQWQALSGKHPRIEWHRDFSEIPKKPLLLVTNEFFDALPVRQFVWDGEWKERMVNMEDNKFIFVIPAKAGILNQELRKRLDKIPAFAGMTIEYSEAAESIATSIGAHIKTHGGAALVIDYGYEGGSRTDTLQAVRAHQYHDPLAEPGTADLTCHVDFDMLKAAAATAGAAAYGAVPQGIFLTVLGVRARMAKLCEGIGDAQKISIALGVERLVSMEQMGDLFKAICIVRQGHPRPEGF